MGNVLPSEIGKQKQKRGDKPEAIEIQMLTMRFTGDMHYEKSITEPRTGVFSFFFTPPDSYRAAP